MTRLLVFIFVFMITLVAQAGKGTFPQGDHVKQLKDKIEFKNSLTQIISNDSDDPQTASKSADRGSLYLKSDDGVLYIKKDAGNTQNWDMNLDESSGLSSIGDVTLGATANGDLLIIDGAGWQNHQMNGEATMGATGTVTLDNDSVIEKVLTGYSASTASSSITATDSILESIEKNDGNNVRLWGRSGGQTVFGGTGAGENLTLKSNLSRDGSIDIQDDLLLSSGTQNYVLSSRGAALTMQSQSSATNSFLEVYSKDGDGTDNVFWRLFGIGTPADITNSELLNIMYSNTGVFKIYTSKSGSGVARDLEIMSDGNVGQIYLEADGDVTFSGSTYATSTIDTNDHYKISGSKILDSDELTLPNTSTASVTAASGYVSLFPVGNSYYIKDDTATATKLLEAGDPASLIIYDGTETVEQYLDDTGNAGVLDAITVTASGATQLQWTAGEIYDHATNAVIETITGFGSATNNAINYLKWVSGTSLVLSTTQADITADEVPISHINMQAGVIYNIHDESIISERESAISDGLENVFPVIVTSGLVVSEDTDVTNAWDVESSAGVSYHDGHNKHSVAQIVTRTASMVRHFKTAGSWDSDENAEIDITQYNNGTNLVAAAANRYYKSVFIIEDDKIHWVYPTVEYVLVGTAIDAALPPIPPGLAKSAKSVAVVIKGSDVAFPASGSDQWIDIRQTLTTASAGTITDHGNLTGLADDDHSQYLLLAGRSGQTITDVLTITGSLILNGTTSVSEILDDDTMASATATSLATSESIKAYSDSIIHDILTIGTPANGLSLSTQELSIAIASTTATGALTNTDWDTFNAKQDALSPAALTTSTEGVSFGGTPSTALLQATNIEIATAGVSATGLLTAEDWGTFNGKQDALSPANLTTTSPDITLGGTPTGALLQAVSIDIPYASTTATGLLTDTDWDTFNGKQDALTPAALTTSTTGVSFGGTPGTALLQATNIEIATAASGTTGLLSGADWDMFNSGGGTVAGNNTFEAKAGSSFSGGELIYLQQKLALVVNSSNNKVDLIEIDNGSEITATIASGTYQKAQLGTGSAYDLIKIFTDSLNTTATGTMTATYTATTNIVAVTSTASFSFKWDTGTNTANTFAGTLGWAVSDTATALTTTATYIATTEAVKRVYAEETNATYLSRSEPHGYISSAVTIDATANFIMNGDIGGFTELIEGERYYTSTATGEITAEASALYTAGFVGPATSSTTVAMNVQPSSVKSPYSFLSNEETKSYGEEIQSNDISCSSSGYCVALSETTTNPGSFYFRYKLPTGSWTDANTTVTIGTPGNAGMTENFGGDYHLKSRIAVDSSGQAVAILLRYNTTNSKYEVWAYYSDLAVAPKTWTVRTGGTALASNAGAHFYVGGLAIRANKAVALINVDANNNSIIYISDDSGSGYAAFAAGVSLTNDFTHNVPSNIHIQYFPDEAGINKHRIVCMGYNTADADMDVQYFKGDGSGEAGVRPFADDVYYIYASAIDSLSPKNRIAIVGHAATTATLELENSNENYNGGVLTFSSDAVDLNPGGSVVDRYNGYSAATVGKFIWNDTDRLVIANDFAALVAGTAAGPAGAISSLVFTTANITSASWNSPVNIGVETGNNQEQNLHYTMGSHSLLYTGKNTGAALADNLTNGKIYGRVMEIGASGALTKHSLTEISDNTDAGFNGYTMANCSTDRCEIFYEELVGGFDVLKTQRLE